MRIFITVIHSVQKSKLIFEDLVKKKLSDKKRTLMRPVGLLCVYAAHISHTHTAQ